MLEKIKNNIVIFFWIFFSISILFYLTESLYNQKKVDDYLVEFNNQNKKIIEKNISQE
jgi:TM2 domain-containing membrane protein YozV